MHDPCRSAGEYRGRQARARDDAVQSRRRTRTFGVDGRSACAWLGAFWRRSFRQAARGQNARAWSRRASWKRVPCVTSADALLLCVILRVCDFLLRGIAISGEKWMMELGGG